VAQIYKATSRFPQLNLIKKLKFICQHFILRIRFSKISLFGMMLIRLKLHQFLNGVARTFPTHKYGRRKKNLAKKGFLRFEW